ncbi:type I secretion system permease/ATPase [Sphingobium sp. B2]|uniref:type I secretion system permease/ATPase n=1 Tax=Sphingobium sp. B2 TaxID=2583228 RepID=UPI00119D259A|nr:ATP-binding cassette domain-containing protein [Sphingobium sp. B2]
MQEPHGDGSYAMRQLMDGPRGTLTALLLLSGALALLPVILAIFAILVFDVTMVGRSAESLLGVVALTIVALVFMTAFAYMRAHILMQFANGLDIRLGKATIEARSRFTAPDGSLAEDMQITYALDRLRRAIAGNGVSGLLDIGAFVPLLIVMIILSGWMALGLFVGGVVMAALLYRAWRRILGVMVDLLPALGERHVMAETHRRHADLVRALGMRSDVVMARRRSARRYAMLDQQIYQIETASVIGGQAMMIAMFVILTAIGAWLAIADKASPGVVLAAAVLGMGALRPFVTVAGHLQELAEGREAWRNLRQLLDIGPWPDRKLSLPAPTQSLSVENVAVGPPGTRTIVIRDVSLKLGAGTVLGVIGMAGAGKSSLLRALAGIWPAVAGKVRIDDAALDQWSDDELTRHIGYLPQTIDLFSGTIAENIARFAPSATSEEVIAAATAANAHDMIVRMPQGYATPVGEEGVKLSVAQRQRVALARALYGDPFLILLDEPATHLDGKGQQALGQTIVAARARGAIVVIVGNASATVDVADYIMVLRDGAMQDFGPKQDVRQRLLEGRKPVQAAQEQTPPKGGEE